MTTNLGHLIADLRIVAMRSADPLILYEASDRIKELVAENDKLRAEIEQEKSLRSSYQAKWTIWKEAGGVSETDDFRRLVRSIIKDSEEILKGLEHQEP